MEAVTGNVPLVADGEEVTVSMVEEEAPGESRREATLSAPVHPEGTPDARLKVEAGQALSSLLVTEMVKADAVPAVTAEDADGESVTRGATFVQVCGGWGELRITVTDTPVALTELVVIDTPDSESVNVWPTVSAGSLG